MKNILFGTILISVVTTLSSFYWSFPGSWRGRVETIDGIAIFIKSDPYHPYKIMGTYPLAIDQNQAVENYVQLASRFANKLEMEDHEGLIIRESNALFIKSKRNYGQELADVHKVHNTFLYVNANPVRDYKIVSELVTGKQFVPSSDEFEQHLSGIIKDARHKVSSGKAQFFEAVITSDGDKISFIKFVLEYRSIPGR